MAKNDAPEEISSTARSCHLNQVGKQARKPARLRKISPTETRRRSVGGKGRTLYLQSVETSPSRCGSFMNSFVKDIFERIAAEVSCLAHYKRSTTTSQEIQTAVRPLLPSELAKHQGCDQVHERQVNSTSAKTKPPFQGKT